MKVYNCRTSTFEPIIEGCITKIQVFGACVTVFLHTGYQVELSKEDVEQLLAATKQKKEGEASNDPH